MSTVRLSYGHSCFLPDGDYLYNTVIRGAYPMLVPFHCVNLDYSLCLSFSTLSVLVLTPTVSQAIVTGHSVIPNIL